MVIEAKGIKGSSRGIEYQQKDKELGQSLEIMRNGIIGDTPKEQHQEMRAIENQYKKSNFHNYRLEIVISPTKEESKNLKKEDWENVAKKALEKSGIDHKNHSYIGHLHTSTGTPHLHLKVSRINFKGEMKISTEDIGKRMGVAANEIGKERGWKTAKETSEFNRREVGKNLNEVLQKEKVKDFEEFRSAMGERGYSIKISQSPEKGVYGMRIISQDQEVDNPSPRLAKSGQGYKLSEIEKKEGAKAKFKIDEIKSQMQKNKISAERDKFNSMTREEKLKFAQEKNDKIFGQVKQVEKTPEKTNENEYSRFDKMKEKKEANKEQEQTKSRGFRR